jgi:hypothetical protein
MRITSGTAVLCVALLGLVCTSVCFETEASVAQLFHYAATTSDSHTTFTRLDVDVPPTDLMTRMLQRESFTKFQNVGGAFDFFPEWLGAARLSSESVSFEDKCFGHSAAVVTSSTADSVELTMVLGKAHDLLCSSWFLLADAERHVGFVVAG